MGSLSLGNVFFGSVTLFILYKLFFPTKSPTSFKKLSKFFITNVIQRKNDTIEKECLNICNALSNEPIVSDEKEVLLLLSSPAPHSHPSVFFSVPSNYKRL
jgi:hypothetical protein